MARLSDTLFLEPCPAWLKDVAIRIDELVQTPGIRQRFRTQLAVWAQEHDKRKAGGGVHLLPDRAMTLPEKYALLAAVHDEVCLRAKRVDPWRTHKQRGSFHRLKAGIPYEFLLEEVSGLKPTDQRRVHACLATVEGDLSMQLPVARKGGPAATAGVADVLKAIEQIKADAKPPRKRVEPPPEPAWKRLDLRQGDSGDDLAILDGQTYRLRGAIAFNFLKTLRDAKGMTVKARTLERSLGERPHRTTDHLPAGLQAIIDKPGRGHRGYCMR